MRYKSGKCIYCRIWKKELTVDHVPPKSIFPKPRPNNLISVPCCQPCNQKFSKDDEYFKLILTMRYDTYESTSAKNNWPSVLRSLRRKNAKGLQKSIFGSMKAVNIVTPSGIFLGESATYQIDYSRVANVIERIIKGIHFKKKNETISKEYDIMIFPLVDYERYTSEQKEVFIDLISRIKKSDIMTIGRDVFSYNYRSFDDDQGAFGIYMTFFKYVPFLAFTARRETTC